MRLQNHEIANYMRLMQAVGQVNIMGFASVTKKLPVALQNAMRPVPGLSDEDSMPVIIQINICEPIDLFDMDSEAWSAYYSSDNRAKEFNEEEVLLQDGFCL